MSTGAAYIPLWRRISISFRAKRMEMFEEFYKDEVLDQSTHPQGKKTILDLGGTFSYWQSMSFKYADSAQFTLLNLEKPEISDGHENFTGVVGDATNLREYGDKQFDLVFSNSVIEHVGDFEAQKRMAAEMKRVGRHYYLQTPNKFFFVEPHYMFPFFQFFPLNLQCLLIRKFKLGFMPKAHSRAEAREIALSVRLMTARELRHLFPEAEICRERFLCFTKSFYLYY